MSKIIRVRNVSDIKVGKLYQIYDRPDRDRVKNYNQAIAQDYKDAEQGIARVPVVIVRCDSVNIRDEEFYGPVLISGTSDHPVGENSTTWNLSSSMVFHWMEISFDDDESLDSLIQQ